MTVVLRDVDVTKRSKNDYVIKLFTVFIFFLVLCKHHFEWCIFPKTVFFITYNVTLYGNTAVTIK